MDKRIKGLFAAFSSLGVALLVAETSWPAVENEAAMPIAAKLEELEQIVINGKRIEQRILESEKRLYERYNALNAINDFDVDCKAKWSDVKSSRYGAAQYTSGCVPVFFANALAADLTFPTTFGGRSYSSTSVTLGSGWSTYTVPTFTRTPAGWGGLGSGRSFGLPGFYSSGSGAASTGTYGAYPTTVSQRPHLLWLERRDAFKANLNKVIRSDPELQALASDFNSLVLENDDALKVVAAARKQQAELRRAAQKCASPTSPRAPAKGCRTG